MSELARRLAERDVYGNLTLDYTKAPRSQRWEWTAAINIQHIARGVRKSDRVRWGTGATPESAMRDLESRL